LLSRPKKYDRKVIFPLDFLTSFIYNIREVKIVAFAVIIFTKSKYKKSPIGG
jgi:hypothetical protein